MPEKWKAPPAWLMDRTDWPEGSREAKAREAWLLRLDGLALLEIGRRLGVSKTAASDLMVDPTGERARARKRKRYGICEGCGAKTFNGGSVKLTKRCQSCQIEKDRAKGAETKKRVAEQVREWTRLHGEPPRLKDWSPAHAALGYGGSDPVKNADAVAAARRAREEGWPNYSTVLYHWGQPDGWVPQGSGNAARSPGESWDRAMERIGVGRREYLQMRKGIDPAEVRRLYVDEDLPSREVAERLGCTQQTVLYHLGRLGVPRRGRWAA